jgi:hypothetical protein
MLQRAIKNTIKNTMPMNMKIVVLIHCLVLAGFSFCYFCLLTFHCLESAIFPNILHTDKKENQIFLIYNEIQNGGVATSYMGKGFSNIWENVRIINHI